MLISCELIEVEKAFREDGKQTANNYKFHLEGAQNLHGDIAKFARGRVQNLPPNNLVRDNLVRIDELFAQFYSVYPRKKGKGAAEKAWLKAITIKDPEEIINAAQLFAQSVVNKEKQYIPYPASWLNKKQWDDEIEVEARPQKSSDLLNSLMQGDYSNLHRIAPFDKYQIQGDKE